MTRTWLSSAVVAGLGVVAACGGNPKPQTKAPAPSPQRPSSAPASPAPTPAAIDPIAALIETSQRHFDEGEREFNAGHLDSARLAFDQAVEVLLESPYGARTDARLREHFDRLVDRINAFEVTALARGDGFTEKNYEAAPIDELLKNATTFPAPPADEATRAAVAADLQQTAHDIPIPQEPKVLVLRGSVPDAPSGLHPGEPAARRALPPDDPERVPRRRPSARPRLHSHHRKLVQDQRAVEGQRQGAMAVHEATAQDTG